MVLSRARRQVRIPGGGKGVHEAARRFLDDHGTIEMINTFGRLYDRRIEADYKLRRHVDQEEANRTLAVAERFCDEISG